MDLFGNNFEEQGSSLNFENEEVRNMSMESERIAREINSAFVAHDHGDVGDQNDDAADDDGVQEDDKLNYKDYAKYGVVMMRMLLLAMMAKTVMGVYVSDYGTDDLLVSYDVVSLFTNVPLDDTIHIIAEKAFENNWFNEQYGLSIDKQGLIDLLTIATKNQLFQYDGNLYEQVDGVAMGSPLGPLMANVFMCNIEDTLQYANKMPAFYRRYVDDTIVFMPTHDSAHHFLNILNESHHSINFTMEIASNNSINFLGMVIYKNSSSLETRVYKKPTNKGLLLHYESHVDNKYKRNLVLTMLDRAFKLSSTNEIFEKEAKEIELMFLRLKYPQNLINNIIRDFMQSKRLSLIHI
ncbi:uncharacterized protein LOC117112580 [Anneissia japonica]|uniref:uncharacterized protein LOC117112580 n=1 Tax=Anneissia japonica TaxID=1529436 RepID=UPI001425BB24|nr:uncharacterized protein LOC117112580 [Anneissia japonica]